MKRSPQFCSMPDCNEPPRPSQRYCKACHTKYMRAWRAKRKRNAEELQQRLVILRKKVAEQQKVIDELKA